MSSRILRHVSSKSYRPQRLRKLAREIGVEEEEYGAFREAVKTLMRAGRVIRGGGNSVVMPDRPGVIIGRFRGHQRGFGFVVPESPTEHGDLFIPPGSTLDAITGDTVAARVTRRGRRGEESSVEGEIVEVVQRGQSRFVGEVVRQGRDWLLLPDGHALHAPVLLGDVSATRARAGDQVVVELSQFPSGNQPGRGVIVEVLGRRGDPGVDTISIIRQYNFRDTFPEEVLEDARRAIRSYDVEQELRRRTDLRNEVIVTIDPDDARDFDDAISIRRTGQTIELGVHIADVSAFVQPGRPLDKEAEVRGNSIYLPRHVLPMLPEVLSNGVCSLQEGEPRLTKSAFITYDTHGHRKKARFANTVIQSSKRLTYRQATDILEGRTEGYDPEIVNLLKEMNHLARAIQKRRLRAGMIVLEIPEVELVLNDEHEVVGVEPTDTSFSHTLIEMFMVEANEVVAERMTELGVPHLRRIHPEPPPDAQLKLSNFLRVLGKALPKEMGRHDLMKLLNSVKGKPESFTVNLAVLRSMSQAEYAPKMIGHYALASEHYSHFTSPIRRYPDLVIHRLLDMYLEGRLPRARREAPSGETLQEIGKRCSYTERRAEDAERELNLVKILRLLEKNLGAVEDGVVTGVTNIGIFVQLQRYLIDGLVRFSDMADDWWEIQASSGSVVGQRSGKRIRIGDALRVQIASVNVAARELNLALVDLLKAPAGTPPAREELPSEPRRRGPRTRSAGPRRSGGSRKKTAGGRRGYRRR